MNKELEALDKLWFHAKYDLKQNNNLYFEYLDIYKGLKKALKPPTAEEVCEVLSEYYGREVLYSNDNRNGFHFYNSSYIVMLINEEIHFTDSLYFEVKRLPPHIIEIIAKFFRR